MQAACAAPGAGCSPATGVSNPGTIDSSGPAVVSTAPTLGRDALGCTRTAVPQALQKAACSSSGISHCAQYWSSAARRHARSRADRSKAASIRPTCSTLRTRKIKIAQDDQAPEDAQHHAQRRVADEGEQVGAGLVRGVGQNGLRRPHGSSAA